MFPPGYKSIADDRADKRKATRTHKDAVYADVDKRDGMVCRCCGRRLVRTLELKPNRLERHHVIPLSQMGETETWNMVVLSQKCHEKVTRHQMTVVGNADEALVFTADGKTWRSPNPKRREKLL